MKKLEHIIGITGPAHSGKDTAADYICKIARGYHKESFANPIKKMLGLGLDMSHDQLYGEMKDEVDDIIGKSPRELLQTLGTEWGRKLVHPDIWVYAMRSYLDRNYIYKQQTCYVIPDVRFENEASFIRQHGTLIHITGRDHVIDQKDHASEAGVAIQREDLLLLNKGSLNDFLMNTCDCYHMAINRLK